MGVGPELSVLCFCLVWMLTVMASENVTTTAAVDTCISQPCENGGTCTAYPNAFICRCPDSFNGLRCEIPTSEQVQTACSTMPCVRGDCVSTSPLQYTCMCPSEWRGSTCDIDVDECSMLTPCMNGAVCTNTRGSYSCECRLGFTGVHCEQGSQDTEYCSTNMCNNSGTCIIENSRRTCICSQGYNGETCMNRVTCSHDGNTFYEEQIRTDDCNKCHCRAGEWLCTTKFCGSVYVRFDFIGDYDSVVRGKDDSFKSSLINNLAQHLSFDERMIANLQVSSGSIHVEFSLVPLVESQIDIADVAGALYATLISGTYYFRFGEASLFVDASSVKLEQIDPTTDDNSGPVLIDNLTLILVCSLVGVLVLVAVIVGLIVIVKHRKRSEQTSMGQFGGREKHEEYTMNNTKHHNELYDSLPADDKRVNEELKDINIAMFKLTDQSKSGPNYV